MTREIAKIEEYSSHYPVMLREVLQSLDIQDEGIYLDCTFGAGGYSRAILQEANCHLIAIDQDPNAQKYTKQFKQQFGNRFEFIQCNFAEANKKLSGKKFDGIVLDLGVSSMQLDEAERGFSFQKDGALDMRMSRDGMSAADFVNSATEQEIADVIYNFGDERDSYRIARAIIRNREEERIETTLKLAEIVRSAKKSRGGKIDPATKTFQAIRIYVNRELDALSKLLRDAQELLKSGGRIVVVTFHSLEDVIVKNFFREYGLKKVARSKYSTRPEEVQPGKWLRVLSHKAIKPSVEEVRENVRSRSAKLRVAEKIGGENVSQ